MMNLSLNHIMWNFVDLVRPCRCRESVWNLVDSTQWSSRGWLLWKCVFACFRSDVCVFHYHEWDFPLHGVWGNLAELRWEGLVWTPRWVFPQIPSAGSWERSRYAIAVESYTPTQGDGRDFRGRGRSQALRVVHGWIFDQTVRYLDLNF